MSTQSERQNVVTSDTTPQRPRARRDISGESPSGGYDTEGRPYIHASWDEDETDVVA